MYRFSGSLAAWHNAWLNPPNDPPFVEPEPTDDDLYIEALIDKIDADGPFAAGVPITVICAERRRARHAARR